MKLALLAIIVGALYLLHQDFWFWRTAQPLLFGFIPVGLSYHAGFTILTSLVMWLLVSKAWPAHLEEEVERGDARRGGSLQSEAEEDQAS